MTPSASHDSAYSRDAGHDEMQVAFLRWLKATPQPCMIHKGVELIPGKILPEAPLLRDSIPVAWIDVAQMYNGPEGDGSHPNYKGVIAYEIEPVVYSVGALCRQCRSIEYYIKTYHTLDVCRVVAVVRQNDPKLAALIDFGVEVMQFPLNQP